MSEEQERIIQERFKKLTNVPRAAKEMILAAECRANRYCDRMCRAEAENRHHKRQITSVWMRLAALEKQLEEIKHGKRSA